MQRPFRYRALPAFALVVGLAATGCGGGGKEAGGDARPADTAPPVTQPAPAVGTSTVATAKVASVKVFAKPGDTAPPIHTLANPTESTAPLVFLAERTEGDWMLVNLPVRPNGSTGWVKTSDVTTSTHDYKMNRPGFDGGLLGWISRSGLRPPRRPIITRPAVPRGHGLSNSSIVTGSPQQGDRPPRPRLRMNVLQSSQRCSPSERSSQLGHS